MAPSDFLSAQKKDKAFLYPHPVKKVSEKDKTDRKMEIVKIPLRKLF